MSGILDARKKYRVFLGACMAVLVGVFASILVSQGVFAGTFDGVTKVAQTLYKDLRVVVTAAGILSAAFCAIKIIIASDKAQVAQAKSWLIAIVVGVVLFYLAPALVNSIKNVASESQGLAGWTD